MPKIVDHAAYRDALLEAAFPVLARRGLACPIRVIAKETGVSTGTLYHYFPNKRVLFENLAELKARQQIEAASALSARAPDPITLFSQMMDMVFAGRDEITGLILLSVDIMRQKDTAQSRSFFRAYFNTYAEALAQLLGISTDRAHVIIACADGLLLHGWIHATEADLKRRLGLFGDLVKGWLEGNRLEGIRLENGKERHNA